jgi:hypothetical protein
MELVTMSGPLIVGTFSVLATLAAAIWACQQVNQIRRKHPRS